MSVTTFFSRAGRIGGTDMSLRTPELRFVRSTTITVFGLGCIGAPCALEFARAGVRELRLLDQDFVDPATIARWPLGLQYAGLPKSAVLAQFIRTNYPDTNVIEIIHRLGGVRQPVAPSDWDVVSTATDGTSLVLDATAEVGIQHLLSDSAAERNLPYVGVDATPGGWGGHIVRIKPGYTKGCWMCYRARLMDGSLPTAPGLEGDEIQTPGCGDVTFTGAGFDMLQIALTAVRTAISTISSGQAGSYPEMDWDVTTVSLRDPAGDLIPPRFEAFPLEKHSECPRCAAF